MALLRSPQGCPWDREQTHDSIKSHLVEEVFEVLDALEKKDFAELKEELGDLLLQIVFHACLAEEAGLFSIEDVVEEIVVKLKRRHPHIFGDVKAETGAEVLVNWERIKATEKARASHLSGVPKYMPALALAQKLQTKAAQVGFDWPEERGILEKLAEEIAELGETGTDTPEQVEEFGDILFTLVNYGRRLGIDSELALRGASNKFRQRFERMERFAAEDDVAFGALPLIEKEQLWIRAKEETNDDN